MIGSLRITINWFVSLCFEVKHRPVQNDLMPKDHYSGEIGLFRSEKQEKERQSKVIILMKVTAKFCFTIEFDIVS